MKFSLKNFSLKTFFGLAILLGIIAAIVGRRIYLSKTVSVPISYDVIGEKKRIEDNYTAPTEMFFWRDPSLYYRLRKQAIAELPRSDHELLSGFLADPSTYLWHEDKHKQIVRENRESILSGTQRWLTEPCPRLANVALMRAIHDDRQAFDLLKEKTIKDLKYDHVWLLGQFPDQWWHDDMEFREALHQLLKSDDENGKHHVVRFLKLAGEKQPWIGHYLAATKSANVNERIGAIGSLTLEELSRRTLEIIEAELATMVSTRSVSGSHIREQELANLLARFLQADDPQLREKASGICKRLSLPDEALKKTERFLPHSPGQQFFQQLCLHGGQEHIDYFVRCAKERRSSEAMKALARLWPKQKAADFAKEHKYDAVVVELLGRDALPYLHPRLRESPNLHLARLAVTAAGGQPAPETVTVLESLLPEIDKFEWTHEDKYITSRKWLHLMKQIGCQNVDDLQSKLSKPTLGPAANMSHQWIVKSIDQQQLVDFLNSSEVGKTIQLHNVYQQIEKKGHYPEDFDHNDLLKLGESIWGAGYSAREFTFHALGAAGIARECSELENCSNYLGHLLEMINNESVGANSKSANAAKDHRIWLAPKHTPPKIHVTFGRRTFELNVYEDQGHPILIAEMLNTMLDRYTQYDRRFYAYIYVEGCSYEHYIAYLKPAIAKQLAKDFGLIPYPPGW